MPNLTFDEIFQLAFLIVGVPCFTWFITTVIKKLGNEW